MPGACPTCPYRDAPEACWAVPAHRRRVCERAAMSADNPHLDLVRRMTTGETPAPPVTRPATTPAPPVEMATLLALVRTCPDRGSVLDTSEQPACGCAELTACGAGKGRGHRPGAVTLTDCILCRRATLPA